MPHHSWLKDITNEDFVGERMETCINNKASETAKAIENQSLLIGISASSSGGRQTFDMQFQYYAVVLGASPLDMAGLTAIQNLGSNVLQFFWGSLADRIGRKPLILLSFLVLSISAFVIFSIKSIIGLFILALIISFLGRSGDPAWIALIDDNTSEDRRGSFLGKITSIGTISGIIFLLLSSWLMDQHPAGFGNPEPFYITFYMAGALFTLAFFLSILLQDHYYRNRRHSLQDQKRIQLSQAFQESWNMIKTNKGFRRLLLIDGLYMTAMASAWAIFPILTVSIARSWLEVALSWAIFTFPFALGQSIGGRLADKFSRKYVIMCSRFFLVLVPISFILSILTNDFTWIILSSIPGGFGVGASDVSMAAYSLDFASKDMRGRFLATRLSIVGLATFIGSIASGFFVNTLLALQADFTLTMLLALTGITLARFVAVLFHLLLLPSPKEEAFRS